MAPCSPYATRDPEAERPVTTVLPEVTIEPAGTGMWDVSLPERWNVGRHQNGGVLLAAASSALAAATGQPHPLTVTAHYLRSAAAGQATINATVIRQGRTAATGTAELCQDGSARMLAGFADGFPPTLLSQAELGWLPTLELTVHVLAVPVAEEPWLRAELRTRTVTGGLVDEDGELWDASGQLVARFGQLGLLPGSSSANSGRASLGRPADRSHG